MDNRGVRKNFLIGFRRHEYDGNLRDGLKGRQSQTRGNFIDIFIEYLACKSIEYMLPYQLNIITW